MLVKRGRFEDIEFLYGNTPNILSELIRTAFVPKDGCRFIVADFSAIEARVLAWLAGEKWRLNVFASHGKIYEAAAARIFNVPIEEVTKGSPLRQRGKISELACIAEGELVLTDRGLVPIEDITLGHQLWDGEEWVTHDGAIYKGIREVITYGGLTATEDHLVWVEGKSEPVRFTEATASSSYLIQTGNGRYPIWMSENNQLKKTQKLEVNTSKVRVYDIRNAGKNNRFTVSNVLVHNCGYGGGVGALKAMGAVEMGVDESELQGLITNWRNANPNITKFWWEIDAAALKAVKERTATVVGKIKIHYESGIMFITLPSGRKLSYIKPRIEPNKFGRDGITYEGIGTAKKWDRIETYGPKLVENIVQAASRDLLAESMLNIERAGYRIVMHCHDEIIVEVPIGFGSIQDVCNIMEVAPSWIDNLPLRVDGFECEWYKKG
jgi:DNA polymerase